MTLHDLHDVLTSISNSTNALISFSNLPDKSGNFWSSRFFEILNLELLCRLSFFITGPPGWYLILLINVGGGGALFPGCPPATLLAWNIKNFTSNAAEWNLFNSKNSYRNINLISGVPDTIHAWKVYTQLCLTLTFDNPLEKDGDCTISSQYQHFYYYNHSMWNWKMFITYTLSMKPTLS